MTTENTHQNLINMLISIGLREEEAKVYLAVLELGPSSVWDISIKSGIKRPTCYVILDALTNRGITEKSRDRKKTIYSANDPTQIAREFDRKKKDFEQNLSQFEALSSKATEKPQIRIYEGEEGIKRAYDISLNQAKGTEMLICSNEKVLASYPEYFERYLKRRVKLGIKVKLLLADTPENRVHLEKDKKELRETRFLPKDKFDPRGEMEIYNDKIINIAYSESNPFATVIESKAMAFDEKQRFMLLWEKGKEIK